MFSWQLLELTVADGCFIDFIVGCQPPVADCSGASVGTPDIGLFAVAQMELIVCTIVREQCGIADLDTVIGRARSIQYTVHQHDEARRGDFAVFTIIGIDIGKQGADAEGMISNGSPSFCRLLGTNAIGEGWLVIMKRLLCGADQNVHWLAASLFLGDFQRSGRRQSGQGMIAGSPCIAGEK